MIRFWTLFFIVTLACEAHHRKDANGNELAHGHDDHTWVSNMGEAEEKKGILEINKGITTPKLVDGDIIPGPHTRNTITNMERIWPSTRIPFVYNNLVSLEAIGSIELARQEYKLRTCLDFYEREDEANYISFRSLNGCYSSVGMVGGSQTISIGSGCERMATVCHEMMHAIGIYHEQSRADRNDYVKIEYDKVESGYENNFYYYDWDTTDARRVPYDYNSIMHYSDSGFSTDGSPTIVTLDPKFQNVIGQRLTFSRGDTTKINRMYSCSDTLLYSYNCNFELESACGYEQDYEDDQIDWFRYVIGDDSVSVPPNTPTVDGTDDIDQIGSFMILNTTGVQQGELGMFKSMRFLSKVPQQCLQFSFYLDRVAGSNAVIDVHVGYIDELTGNITGLSEKLNIVGDYGNKWQIERLTIDAPSAYRLVLHGHTGLPGDVLGLDDMSVIDKPCEDAFFVTEDYNNILQNSSKGDYFISKKMYTNDGYAFNIKLYPKGTQSANDAYMSMYIGLVQGDNDDQLTWPFCNRFIRLKIEDQSANPLFALSKYSEFMTDSSERWERPTSGTVSDHYYGYSNFMNIDDLTNTHHYLKHDRLMVSILTQDMNWVDGTTCSSVQTRSSNRVTSTTYAEEEAALQQEIKDREDMHDTIDEHHHHDEHHQHDEHEQHHQHENHHHQDDDKKEKVAIGVAVGIALGSSFFILIVMSVVLCCVNSSYKPKLHPVANNITVQTTPQNPPSYGNLAFLPTVKA